MEILKTITEIRSFVRQNRKSDKSIGLVPTMGALHKGHISLIEKSVEQTDVTVASIFVNPTQFNKTEDLEKYPRAIDQDIEMLKAASCNALFLPEESELYPVQPTLKIGFGKLSQSLEGKFRPGHFDGVGLVVSKFFNIVQPDKAFFGQKDLQQFYIIKSLRDQLNFPIQLTMVPTVREDNGLAMSSRNLRLSEKEREEASLISYALNKAKQGLLSGKSPISVSNEVEELFLKSECFKLEYFEIISVNDFEPINKVEEKEKTALCIAAEIGNVRLIDNLMLIS